MDWALLLAGVEADVTDVISDVLPIALTIFVLLAGIGIVFKVFGKAGVRK